MNRVGCGRCGDVITSTHRHDFVTCSCGAVSVDGGSDYHKRCFDPDAPRWTELPDDATLHVWRVRLARLEAADEVDRHEDENDDQQGVE